jgi:hypothetical protein
MSTATAGESHNRGERELSEGQQDAVVLDLLLCDASNALWSIDEIARTLDCRGEVEDSVGRLAQAGLAHRLGEFVFPTRAARRAGELGAGSV